MKNILITILLIISIYLAYKLLYIIISLPERLDAVKRSVNQKYNPPPVLWIDRKTKTLKTRSSNDPVLQRKVRIRAAIKAFFYPY